MNLIRDERVAGLPQRPGDFVSEAGHGQPEDRARVKVAVTISQPLPNVGDDSCTYSVRVQRAQRRLPHLPGGMMSLFDAMDVFVDDLLTVGLGDAIAHDDDDDVAFDRWLASVSPSDLDQILSDLAIEHAGTPKTLHRSA
jgi:hypothetical protein